MKGRTKGKRPCRHTGAAVSRLGERTVLFCPDCGMRREYEACQDEAPPKWVIAASRRSGEDELK